MKKPANITRRDFVLKSTLTAAAPLVCNFKHKSSAKAVNKTINVGMIGLGRRFHHAHIPTLLKFPDVRIAALCDVRKERLEEATGKATQIYHDPGAVYRDPSTGEKVRAHNPSLYQNYEDLLRQKDLDCIFVSTPPDKHKYMVLESLYAGFSVYVDKPMVLTLSDCDAIERAIKNTKGTFIIGQQLRYSPMIRKKIEMIHSGEIGSVGLIHWKRISGSGTLGVSNKEPSKKWLITIEQGGDHLLENAVHRFDLFNWIMGTHPTRAAGLGGQGFLFNERYDRDILDHYDLVFEYPENRRVFFTHGSMGMPGIDPQSQIIYGTKAVIDWRTEKLYKRVPEGKPRSEPEDIEKPGGIDDMNYLCCKDFFECHRTGKKPFDDFEVGKTTVLTALLGRKAIYEKRVVTWDDLLKEGATQKRLDQI